MGKLLRGSIDEIEKCARGCRFYAEHGEQFLSEQIVSSMPARSYVRYEPLGAVLAIMPWNFPFWQVFRFAAPALMAGNVGLLKHASNVPQCALAIEDIFREAGFDPGVFQTLLIENEAVGKDNSRSTSESGHAYRQRTRRQRGGERRRSRSEKECARARRKRSVHCHAQRRLDDAISTGVKARMVNSGQSCIAAKRFIIADAIYDQYRRAICREDEKIEIGRPEGGND